MAVAGLGLLAACERPLGLTQPPPPPSSSVVQVVTSPTNATLDPYQRQQFLAYGRTQAGDSVAVDVTWSASGGTITTGGLYVADTTAGTYQVTAATSTSTKVSGSSQVQNRGPVAQIVLTPTSASVTVGGTVQFAVFGRRNNGDSVAVTVAYSATGGTISATGLYTAGQSAGAYRVIATQSGGKLADTVAVTISNVPVASVTVSPAAASLTVGATAQLTATPKDSNGTALSGRAVTWASSNPAVATVSNSGVVSGNAAGSATITATSETKSSTATVTVTNVPVASVTVSPASTSLLVGATQQFSVVTKDAAGNTLTGRTVTWASSNTAVATVSGSGLVTGNAAGSATITATSETVSGTAAVTVTNVPVASVTLSPASASLVVGATQQFTAVTKDAAGNTLAGRTVTWASSNTTVAMVSGSGLATGMAGGPATITATSEGQSGTAAVSVTAPGCMTSAGAWQNRTLASQTGGFEAMFDATAATASTNAAMGLSNGPAADWTNLAAIVRFDSASTIDARNGGVYAATTAIPYTAGTTYHFRLDVNLASQTYDIYVTPAGAAEQLLGKAFAFRTEQATVSVLNNLGLNANAGSATVCNVSVSPWTPPPPAPVASVTVSPAAASVQVGTTAQLTAALKDANGLPTSGSVTWTTSNAAVATVSTSGLVTGLVAGTATVTATSGGQSGSATVTVNPAGGPTPLYTLGNGANYYVAPSGSDANPCTAAAPCYTMQRVSQLMGPGDNAHFAPGNYTWSYSGNKVNVSGTATAPISYISDTKWGAKVYGSGCDPIWNDGDYVQIINFDVTGNCSEGITTNGNYSKVIGNRVHDLPFNSGGYGGIKGDCCYSNRTGIQIIGNVVDNIAMGSGSNLVHGIYTAGPNSVITDNIVTRVSAACITHYHGATHSIVSNNVVANCKYGIQIAADGSITSDDYTTVDNNIAVNNGRGIYEYPAAGPHNVYNNNIVYNNSTANFDLCCGGTQSGSITLTAAQFSALFVNYTGDMTGDYHLRSGAVAIDAGTTSCAAGVTSCVPRLDMDGVARPVGTAYDIGAYEWH
jgi:uncharacterized protein YjdB